MLIKSKAYTTIMQIIRKDKDRRRDNYTLILQNTLETWRAICAILFIFDICYSNAKSMFELHLA